jgi:hypothetical protein
MSNIKDQVLVKNNPPDAARFDVGATSLAQIKEATDRPRVVPVPA